VITLESIPTGNELQVKLHILPYDLKNRVLVDTWIYMMQQFIISKYDGVKIFISETSYHQLTEMLLVFTNIEDSIEFKLSLNS